jgi:hypothetical protein
MKGGESLCEVLCLTSLRLLEVIVAKVDGDTTDEDGSVQSRAQTSAACVGRGGDGRGSSLGRGITGLIERVRQYLALNRKAEKAEGFSCSEVAGNRQL